MKAPELFRAPAYVASALGIDVETASRLMSSQRITSRDIARPGAKRRMWRTTDSAIAQYQAMPEQEEVKQGDRKYGVLRSKYPVGMTRDEYELARANQ